MWLALYFKMENINDKIEFLQRELIKPENRSKAKQRLLVKQLKEARQEKLDDTKKELEEYEKMEQNLKKALEMAKIKKSLEEMKQKFTIEI